MIASVEKGHEHRNAVLKGAASCVGGSTSSCKANHCFFNPLLFPQSFHNGDLL